ncbi:hypothetical protein EIP91_008202 [Steccherinum ochraceum]|uniref:Uncharacterized protein n=1 Tax=Steccherinum ochraceum TaxID=92696 RepID=A0A4V2MX92_9APHY|nr:hypothetical protein EIP91_008202 [Steccherinum ochraceum]
MSIRASRRQDLSDASTSYSWRDAPPVYTPVASEVDLLRVQLAQERLKTADLARELEETQIKLYDAQRDAVTASTAYQGSKTDLVKEIAGRRAAERNAREAQEKLAQLQHEAGGEVGALRQSISTLGRSFVGYERPIIHDQTNSLVEDLRDQLEDQQAKYDSAERRWRTKRAEHLHEKHELQEEIERLQNQVAELKKKVKTKADNQLRSQRFFVEPVASRATVKMTGSTYEAVKPTQTSSNAVLNVSSNPLPQSPVVTDVPRTCEGYGGYIYRDHDWNASQLVGTNDVGLDSSASKDVPEAGVAFVPSRESSLLTDQDAITDSPSMQTAVPTEEHIASPIGKDQVSADGQSLPVVDRQVVLRRSARALQKRKRPDDALSTWEISSLQTALTSAETVLRKKRRQKRPAIKIEFSRDNGSRPTMVNASIDASLDADEPFVRTWAAYLNVPMTSAPQNFRPTEAEIVASLNTKPNPQGDPFVNSTRLRVENFVQWPPEPQDPATRESSNPVHEVANIIAPSATPLLATLSSSQTLLRDEYDSSPSLIRAAVPQTQLYLSSIVVPAPLEHRLDSSTREVPPSGFQVTTTVTTAAESEPPPYTRQGSTAFRVPAYHTSPSESCIAPQRERPSDTDVRKQAMYSQYGPNDQKRYTDVNHASAAAATRSTSQQTNHSIIPVMGVPTNVNGMAALSPPVMVAWSHEAPVLFAPLHVNGSSSSSLAASKDDARVADLLRDYHRRNLTNKNTVSKLLQAEHGIEMSATTVKRRQKQLGLMASKRTTEVMPDNEKRQLLMDQLAKDPGRRRGPRSIRESIANESSVHLTGRWITEEMRRIDPVGFDMRHPQNKRKEVQESLPQGPHFAWTGYGYEKLTQIGFPIWCLRDSWSINWLGMWVMPVRRDRLAHTYRYLNLVKTLEGMPMQGTSSDSKEVTLTYSLTYALREALTSEPAGDEPTIDRYLRRLDGVHAERGTAHLQFDWGDNMLATWEAGKHIYNPDDPHQYELVQWLWSTLIQKELDKSRYSFNNHRSRKDRNKARPTGITPSVALALHADHGGINCLQAIDGEIVGHLIEDIGGEEIVRFVSKTFERRAAAVLEALGIREVTMANVWDVFSQMLPVV